MFVVHSSFAEKRLNWIELNWIVSKLYISELEWNILLVRIKLNKFQDLTLLYTEIFCSHMLIT